MNRIWHLVLSLLLGAAWLHADAPPDTALAAATQNEPALGVEVAQVLNAEREARGLWPLRLDVRLQLAAAIHNDWMTTHECFAHQCPNEHGLYDRMIQAGYYPVYRLGEIIGINQTTSYEVVEGWLNSEGHRNAMLSQRYAAIGCAHRASSWGILWTCNFGWQDTDGEMPPEWWTPGATPTVAPAPATPVPTSTPVPTATPLPTTTLLPTATPVPTAVPAATAAPNLCRWTWHHRQGWRWRC